MQFAFPPTPEQSAILGAVESTKTSLMVTAYAGCTKTTVLEMIAHHPCMASVSALALAFNVKIKKELETRFPKHIHVKTMNGLGHVAWGKAIGKKVVLEEKKLGNLVTRISKEQGINLLGDQWGDLRRLVSQAMMSGMVPSKFPQKGLMTDRPENWEALCESIWVEPTELMIDLARTILIESIIMGFAGTISFDDQIYLSTMFGGIFPRYPLVLVDEAQDLSPLNHIQLRKVSPLPDDRLIVVGDPKQAIYAFRGADSESMAKIRALKSAWIDLPLATTFRCPKLIVTRQQDHAPGFTAWHMNEEGVFAKFTGRSSSEQEVSWGWKEVETYRRPGRTVSILCRNNAPLLSMAFKLIRQGTGVVMLGRDIGKGLIALSKKIIPLDDTPAEDCARLILQWREHETFLAMANNKEEKIDGINDRADCLEAVLEGSLCKNAGTLRSSLDSLFSAEVGKVTLSTGHRAKGLEWDTVVHLDPWRIPSKWAKEANLAGDPRQLQQELNLKYVIETRTKHNLVLANLEDFQ